MLIGASRAAAQESSPERALVEACRSGNAEKVAELLKQGATPDSKVDGRTALHSAAQFGHVKVMKLLIEHGADINAKDSTGRTALLEAAGSRDVEVIRTLLKAGAKPDGPALGQAGWLGRMEAAKLLLEAGADPSAGIVGAAQAGHVELVRLLLDKGANVNAQSKDGITALHAAGLQGGLKTVQFLLTKGADPNATNNRGETPLHMAVSGDCEIETIKLLVRSGAKLDTANYEGITPIRRAAIHRVKPVYQWMLQASGGIEPPPRPDGQPSQLAAKPTKELLADLVSEKTRDRFPIQRELVIRGKQVIPEMLKSAESGTEIGRYYELFAALGPQAETARPKLESLLADKKQVFFAAMTLERIEPGSLGKLSTESREKTAASLYEAIIDPELVQVARYQAGLLTSMGEISKPYLLKLLRSGKPGYQALAVRSLRGASFFDTDINAELLKLARDEQNPSPRYEVARVLGTFGGPTQEAKAALLSIIKTPPQVSTTRRNEKKINEWRRLSDAAARSLASFGPNVIDDLIPLMSPMSSPGRIPAITTLQSIGAPAVPRLIELLAHQDQALAVSAGVALNKIGYPAVPALAKALSTGNEQVIDRAASALWWIGPGAQDALPALLEIAGSEKRADASRVAAARAALNVDPKSRRSKEILSTIPVLIRVLEKGTVQQQLWSAGTLRGIGPPAREALPMLHKRLGLPNKDRDTGLMYVQEEAREAISAIEGRATEDSEAFP